MPVTLNIFKKEDWENYEWKIYLNNLEILRRANNLKKQEFNKLIGVANAFRKDINRPGRGTILEICKKFNVTESWLSTPRKIKKGIEQFKIGDDENQYVLHGDWKPPEIDKITGFPINHEFWRAYKLLHEIYDSGDEVYIRAIYSNLVAFNNAIKLKADMQTNEQRIRDIEDIVEKITRRSDTSSFKSKIEVMEKKRRETDFKGG